MGLKWGSVHVASMQKKISEVSALETQRLPTVIRGISNVVELQRDLPKMAKGKEVVFQALPRIIRTPPKINEYHPNTSNNFTNPFEDVLILPEFLKLKITRTRRRLLNIFGSFGNIFGKQV